MNHNGNNIEARLWEAADELRAIRDLYRAKLRELVKERANA